MEWLKDILKTLAISRTLVLAVFATTATMFWGPRLEHTLVPAVPAIWLPIVFGLMMLSGSLLILWSLVGLADWAKIAARKFRSTKLSDMEVLILVAMGKRVEKPLDLDGLDYSSLGISRLELLDVCTRLEEKGLVSVSLVSDLVFLTRHGRRRALEETRKRSAPSAA